MLLSDRIETRRFVGREFLLWLWFESDMFEATLSTSQIGAFGLWIEKQLVLSAGKEVTRIKGASPTKEREAKASLLSGKLPESAGFHLSWGEREISFVLKAEQLSLSGLRLPTVLGKNNDAPIEGAPRKVPPRKRKKADQSLDERGESDEVHEAFYERMHFTREVEQLIESLYRDFLVLRLGPAWDATVVPAERVWVCGAKKLDVEEYRKARGQALSSARLKQASKPR